MNTIFITDIGNMTYGNCLNQPKPMVEWILNKKLSKNPIFIKILGNSSHLLIRKSQLFVHNEEEDGENQDHEIIISSNLI